MRRSLPLVAALALVFAAPSSAKEITAAKVCGSAGCSDVELPQGLHEFPGSSVGEAPPPAGPFVAIELTFDGSHHETVWYVPDANVFAVPDGTGWVRWAAPSAQQVDRVLVEAAAAVPPHQPRVVAAFVGGKPVEGDVSGYLRLFAVGSDGGSRGFGDAFSSVSLTTKPASPWAQTRLWFYPDSGLLQRGVKETVLLPGHIADDLRAARTIDGAAPASGFDWPLVTGSLLVAFALLLAATLLSRRGRQPRPA